MGYRDVLAPDDVSEEARACTRLAAGLAKRFDAHLIGVYLRCGVPPSLISYAGMDAAPSGLEIIIESHEEAVKRNESSSSAHFQQLAEEAGVPAEWRVIDGDSLMPLVEFARRTDLTVVPREVAPVLGAFKYPAAEVIAQAGGPILVAPPGVSADGLGKRVLLAWNGSLEASRALRGAWPFLERADAVDVLLVSTEGGGLATGLIEHMERHGCRANLVIDDRADRRVDEAIRQQASTLGADLLVMGFYSRPRLAEVILGGTTRELIAHPPAPLLMAH
jgi:nucleotide-binding universal stress UspA family protein